MYPVWGTYPSGSSLADGSNLEPDSLALCSMLLKDGYPVVEEARKDMVDLLLVLAHYPDPVPRIATPIMPQPSSHHSILVRLLEPFAMARRASGF